MVAWGGFESGGVLWNGQNESERHEYKYIHKCQSLGKVEKMTTIGKIGRMDAADSYPMVENFLDHTVMETLQL